MDCLFCILWKEKQPKEQVDERKAEGKNLKDAKVSSTFEVQAASTHQQNRNQSCGAFCLSWIAMTYYYEATSLLNQDTLYQL